VVYSEKGQVMKLDKRLIREAGDVRVYLGITVGLGVLAALLIIGQAQLLSQVIDQVFIKASFSNLNLLLAGLLLIVIGRAALGWGGEIFASRAARRVKTKLRENLFSKLLKLGPAYSRGERSGELTGTTVEGVESLDPYFSQYLPQVFLTMFVPVIVLGVIFTADLLSGVVLLVTAPILPLFMILIGKRAEALNKKQWNLLSQMSAHFLDVLQGMTTLKLFGRSRHQQENIRKISERWSEITLKVLRVAFLSALVMELGATLSTAIIAVEIGFRLLYAQMSFQSALFVLLLAPEFYLPLRSLGSRFHASMSASAASGRIYEILDAEVTPQRHKHEIDTNNLCASSVSSVSACPRMGAVVKISFEQVSYAYQNGERPALKNVSFEIEAGRKTALVGPSGAGKSTIAQLLLRFMEPDQGAIKLSFVDGSVTTSGQIKPQSWREQIAWVPQNPYLFNTTVADNIRLGRPDASMPEVIQAAKQAHAHEFIEALPQGYQTVIGERGARLSGGQAQRISLARAFLKNAPILLLDEATSNLDAENETLIMDATEQLMQGRTVLMIAHRPSTIARADRIIKLEAGQVVQPAQTESYL
jgi:ATP-binding cassette subfamily C protein CydD